MNRPDSIFVVAAILFTVGLPALAAERILAPACELAIHEEQVELEDTRLELESARSRLAAFEKIFDLIDRLWKADATERMTFLRGKYDRDAARLDVDHYRAICGTGDAAREAGKVEESLDEIRARLDRGQGPRPN